MSHSLIIDNWTLQSAGELLSDGLDGEPASELVLTKNGQKFRYEDVPADAIRFEAFCQFLNCIVFVEELFVDKDFASAWERFEPINQIHSRQILIKKPFQNISDEWISAREAIADQLCINGVLLEKHRANKRAWGENRQTPDPYLSQIIWGGAGMLARADYFSLPYLPHPLRASLFSRTQFLSGTSLATERLSNFVTEERAKIYQRPGGRGFIGHIQLPPVVVQIIESANDLQNIVNIALQIRDEYKNLRHWLGKLQMALNQENAKEILAHERLLKSVARNLDSYGALTPQGDTSLQIGFGWLKVATKAGSPMNVIKNLFGVRAELNRLVLAPAGHNALNKFLKMLGEQHTKYGKILRQTLFKRLSQS